MSKIFDKPRVAVSIIASDLSLMGRTSSEFDRNIIDYLHMDVMDGHFVPNLTFGPGYIANLRKNCTIPMDVHLMIEKPENSVGQYLELKPWCVTIHYESTRFPARLLGLIQKSGVLAGLALNPATPMEAIYDLLPFADMVLIMSIDPGFYGQAFMEISLGRIERLRDFIDKNRFSGKLIQVDGGINRENIGSVVNAGAHIVVAGNSAFRDGKINENVRELKLSGSS